MNLSVPYNLDGRAVDPIDFLIGASETSVMAVITGVEGPSYRPVGAIMALGNDGTRVGSLSSGCIEGDLLVHARSALESGNSVALRYGRGSPFIDISLPCGGGLDILLIPRPNPGVLEILRDMRARREPSWLDIEPKKGEIAIGSETAPASGVLQISFTPEIRFVTFGKGPEASTFAALVHSIGFPGLLVSPDAETREIAEAAGCETRSLVRPEFPADVSIDPWTAIIVFFHDHEWEPPILAPALRTDAFYVGAQGSQRTAAVRVEALEVMGTTQDDIERLKGPIGLVSSARDARTLAVSVLAEVLDVARSQGHPVA